VAGGYEAEAGAGLRGVHVGVEVGHGDMPTLGVAGTPLGLETDGQAPEHAQHPDGVTVTHAALVFVGRGIQTLMDAPLDAPVLAIDPQEGLRQQVLGTATGQEPDGFGLVLAEKARRAASTWSAGTRCRSRQNVG